jgi:hypothetical protein
VREWVRELYAERGQLSIDPVVFFTLQLVMVFQGIRSERQRIETAIGSSRRRGLGGPSMMMDSWLRTGMVTGSDASSFPPEPRSAPRHPNVEMGAVPDYPGVS